MTITQPLRGLKSRPITFTFEIPTAKLNEFWSNLQKGKVYASKCVKCGNVSFPPAADCSRCLHSGVEWIEIQGEGEIETFTHVTVRPASFSDSEPYTVAVARMKEGLKILAWVADANPTEVKVGSKARLVAKDSVYGPTYAFVLVRK